MRDSLKLRAAFAATAMSLVLTSPALAQGASDASGSDIVVTARRIEERLQDVPISITVYNQQQLANRNIVSSADLATYTPSLNINSRYGPDKPAFAIRGFSQDLNTVPTVAVYFADVVAPRLQSNIQSGNGAGVGSMFDLQNVQVLKGPQGTLFGRNTTGGAILLVPQKPTDKLEGYVEGTIGNYSEHRIQGVINIPLSDTIRFRAGLDRNLRDGYLNNRSGIGPKDFNDIDYWAGRASLVIDVTPDIENYTIFTYSRSDTNGWIGKVAYVNNGTAPANTPAAIGGSATVLVAGVKNQIATEKAAGFGYYDVESNDPNPFVVGRQWQVINTTTWKAADTLTVKNIFSYGESKESYSSNLSGDTGVLPGLGTFPFVITYPGDQGPQGNERTLTEELQFQGNVMDGRLTWQAGGYLEHSDPIGQQQQYTQIFTTPCTDVYAYKCTPLALAGGAILFGQIGNARNNYYYRDYGLYAQGTFKFTEQLSLTAGIRNTWDYQEEVANNVKVTTSATGPMAYGTALSPYTCSRAGASQLEHAPGAPGAPAGSAALLTNGACTRTFVLPTKSTPTWLIDLDYKPTPDILVYAKYARGYRFGGINEANAGAETWKPEKIDDYEIGLKASFHGAVSGNISIAGFWNEFKNQQYTVALAACVVTIPGCTNPPPTGINAIVNLGKSRVRGIEVEGSLLPIDDVRIDFGYSYLDTEILDAGKSSCDSTRFNCANAPFPTAGTELLFAPKNRFTISGTYTLPFPENIGKVSAGATFVHTDKQYNSHSNDLYYAAGVIPYNASISPATDLLNLNLSWERVAGSALDFGIFATNVTNQKYFVAATSSTGTIGGEYIMLGEPRMYGIRAKIHFGQ
jgi:iron complex outermembrane receptor protein